MSKHLLYLLFLAFFGVSLKAQNQSFETKPITKAENFPQKGTYQILLKQGTDKVTVPNEILFEAERKRDASVIIYLVYNENVRLKIYPVNTITAPDFKPFEEYIYEE